jgi:hypothetical protein
MHTEYRIDFIFSLIFPFAVRPISVTNYSTPLSILGFRLSGSLAASMEYLRFQLVRTTDEAKELRGSATQKLKV